MVQEAPLKIYARGVVSYFNFPARRSHAENKANQQCHFKSSRCPMEQLGTDSCRGTVPMEPPMPNCSMGHQNPDLDFDDTGHFLQGALCTIAARGFVPRNRCLVLIVGETSPVGHNLVQVVRILFFLKKRGSRPCTAIVQEAPCRK